MAPTLSGTAPGAAPGTRPGGRSARVRAAVHRAVVDLLAEGPAEALTIPLVAGRAGVHPTTVYRRWGTLADLLADVASSRFSGDLVVPDTGTLRGDLSRWAGDVADDLTDPDSLALMRATIGAAGAECGCACVADRHDQLAAILARHGSERAVEDVADALLGPIYYRALFTTQPPARPWAEGLVSALLG